MADVWIESLELDVAGLNSDAARRLGEQVADRLARRLDTHFADADGDRAFDVIEVPPLAWDGAPPTADRIVDHIVEAIVGTEVPA
ncbi:MAG: hypothetical protein RIT81_16460 [Deltaproteobacteria bacterium]